MDYYLKTTNETTLWESLEAAGLAYKLYDPQDSLNVPTGDKEWIPTGKFSWRTDMQIDIIGTIYVPTGDTEEVDGRQIPVMQAIDGFHANLRANLTEEQKALLPLIDEPSTPVRVWA